MLTAKGQITALLIRETHQINNPLGRSVKFWLAGDVATDNKDLTI